MKRLFGIALAVILSTSAVFADFKISQLSAKGSATGGEQILVNDAGSNKTITPANIDTYISATAKTLTNKTLTSPVINSPTGIVKGDVGLGNVDNTSDATKNAASVTLTNKTISGSSNTITNVSLSAGVTGTLPLANGGTGQTSATTAINALAPTQTGNSGKVLGTNGTAVSWVSATDPGCSGCVKTEIQDISGVTVDDSSNDDGSALSTWVTAHKTNQILHVTPGVYDVRTWVAVVGLSNFKVDCDPGAIFRKKSAMDDGSNEYFFQIVQSTNVTFDGCRFEGLTTSATEYNAGEQGINCLSCDGFRVVNNYFKDIGDAAVRSTEYPTGGIPSVNTWIEKNTFENISQITTTPASGSVAGTSNIWVLNNKFIAMKWSLKMCTRAPSSGVHVIGNEIDSSSQANLTNHDTGISATATGVGVELCSVSDVWVEDNHIANSQVAGIFAYTNPSVAHFDWSNYHIKGNTIDNTWLGIKVESKAGSDSVAPLASNISIMDNIITNVWHPSGAYSIWLLGAGGFEGSQVKDNIIRNPTSGLYTTIPGSGVTSADNIQD